MDLPPEPAEVLTPYIRKGTTERNDMEVRRENHKDTKSSKARAKRI